VRTHLVCYADDRFAHAQRRLVESARTRGRVDVIHVFTPLELRATEFYAKHRRILDEPRGAGYWLWKPYFIREVIRQAEPGDVVLYIDSGAELVQPIAPLVELCQTAGGLALFRNHGRQNRYWTKRDCYLALGCDQEECYDADQVNAAFSIWQAGSGPASDFADEWLALCCDPQLITDAPSVRLPELADSSLIFTISR
jgi:hypothetical protein